MNRIIFIYAIIIALVCSCQLFQRTTPEEVLEKYKKKYFLSDFGGSKLPRYSLIPAGDTKPDIAEFLKLPQKALNLIEVLFIGGEYKNYQSFSKMNRLKNLSYLSINGSDGLYFKYLSGLKIKQISISESTCIEVDVVGTMIDAEFLSIQRTKVTKIPDLSRLYRLKKIYLSENDMKTLDGIEKIPSLDDLYIFDNPALFDISALKQSNIKTIHMDKSLFLENEKWFKNNAPKINVVTTRPEL